MPELAEGLVEKDEHGYRLVLTLVQIALHDVVVLVPQEHANVEPATLLREPTQDRQVRDHVPAPVLRQHDDVEWTRKTPKGGHVLRPQLNTTLVLFHAVK